MIWRQSDLHEIKHKSEAFHIGISINSQKSNIFLLGISIIFQNIFNMNLDHCPQYDNFTVSESILETGIVWQWNKPAENEMFKKYTISVSIILLEKVLVNIPEFYSGTGHSHLFAHGNFSFEDFTAAVIQLSEN